MILVVFGTTGELIKLAGILTRLRPGEQAFAVCTGQQVEQIPGLLDDLGLPAPDLWLARGRAGRDLERAADIPPWLLGCARSFVRHRARLRAAARAGAARPLVLVHGDTFTTVLGALAGRALGVPVAHVEAGLRSGSWRNPFPEELDRRVTSRLAGLHLAPGAWAAGNLLRARVSGEVIDTGANTIRDALALARDHPADGVELSEGPFGLVSLHRFELLSDPAALRAILTELREVSRRTPLLFVDHPVTVAAVRAAGLDGLFDERLRRVPRQRYFRFVGLLQASAFLVTDSGGSQEECAALGHPCLVHRATTERQDGLAEGMVVLSGMDLGAVRAFLADPEAHRRPTTTDGRSPSEVIVEALGERGFLPR